MSVWVVTHVLGDSDIEVDKVFATAEKADEYRYSQRDPGNYDIIELEVE